MLDVVATAAAFLRDICAEPEDNGLRLIFADWLEENGQEARAEFIRVQIRLAKWEAEPGRPTEGAKLAGWLTALHQETSFLRTFLGQPGCDCERCLRLRERELRFKHAHHWVEAEAPSLVSILRTIGDRETLESRFAVFRRGFVETISLPCADFLDHAEALFRAAPITRVTLSDKKPQRLNQTDQFELYWWWRITPGGPKTGTTDELPDSLLDLVRFTEQGKRGWSTRESALTALSAACVHLGRQRAGLVQAPSGTRT